MAWYSCKAFRFSWRRLPYSAAAVEEAKRAERDAQERRKEELRNPKCRICGTPFSPDRFGCPVCDT
jgi:rubrerythrin